MQGNHTKGKIKIIYIAGYGHSGSTILETLLSCDNQRIGLGELVGIPRELNASFTEEFLSKNEFCRTMYDRVERALKSDGESLKNIEDLNRIEQLLGKKTKRSESRYHRFWDCFIKAATDDPDRQIDSIVDSSKTTFGHARRPYLLQKNEDFDVIMVHLVRHPRQILWKRKKIAVKLSEQEEPEWLSQAKQVIKTTLNWTISNVVPAVKKSGVDRYVCISFEELCEFPIETLKKIESSTGLNLQKAINNVENRKFLPPTCGIAGNIPVKKKEEELRFEPSKKVIPETGLILRVISFLLLPVYKFTTRGSH